MLKKIMFFSFVLMAAITFNSSKGFAKEGYVPHLEPVYIGPEIGNKETSTPVPELTDGLLSKNMFLQPKGHVYWYDYGENVDVYEIYAEAMNGRNNIYGDWIFYDENMNQVGNKYTFGQNSLVHKPSTPYKNVRYFAIHQNNSTFNYSIAEIGTTVKFVEYADLENLILVSEHDKVSLAWDIPKENEDFAGTKIYRNGVFLDSTDSMTNVYIDNDVEPNTTYSYKVTGLYKNGRETKGITLSTVTKEKPLDPSEIPPSNVTDLEAKDITGTSARLTWKNSEDLDLDKVNIYNEDNSLLTSISVNSEYTLSNLNPETTYKFYVALVDVDGNVGSKMPVTFTTKEDVDTTPPDSPRGLSVDSGSNALYVKWDKNIEPDLAGYNIYVNGEKHNSVLVKNLFYSVPNLLNDVTYSISITAVDKSGNESEASTSLTGTPVSSGLPILETNYELKDVALGVESWFSSFWLIIAFAVSIPLSFYVASRIKLMFID